MIKLINRFFLLLIAGLVFANGFAQTSVKTDVPRGWHLLSKQTSGYYGIGLDKAYDFLKEADSTCITFAFC